MATRKPTVDKQPAAAQKAKAKADAEAKAAAEKAEQEAKAQADAEAKAAAEKASQDAQLSQVEEPLECEVLEPQLYGGTKYMPGDFIYLTEEEAAPLIAQQLIRFGTPADTLAE